MPRDRKSLNGKGPAKNAKLANACVSRVDESKLGSSLSGIAEHKIFYDDTWCGHSIAKVNKLIIIPDECIENIVRVR